MELNPDILDALLRVLKDNEVAEFMGCGFHVKFFPETPEEATKPDREPRVSRSLWENEHLWPGGSPPSFTKKDK